MPKTPSTMQVLKIGDEEIFWDHEKTLNAEAIAIEKEFNLTWLQVLVGVARNQASAVTAVVWIMRKRSDPKLKSHEVIFSMGDFELIDPDIDPRYNGTPPEPVEVEPEYEDPDGPKEASHSRPLDSPPREV